MKAFRLLALILAIVVPGFYVQASGIFCHIRSIQNFTKRLADRAEAFGNDLTSKLLQSRADIHSSPRFTSVPEIDRVGYAYSRFRGSVAKADSHSRRDLNDPNADGLLGEKGAKAFTDVLRRKRVLDSDVDLDEMGEGCGYLSRRATDADMEKIVQEQTKTFEYLATQGTSYDEAKFFRDNKIIFEADPDLPIGDMVSKLSSPNNNPAGARGLLAETRVAAGAKQSGQRLRGVGVDEDNTFGLAGKKVDVLTEDYALNVGVGVDTIRNKISNERRALAQAIIDVENQLGPGKFKFAVCEGDPAEALGRLAELNDELRALGSTRAFSHSDIIVLQW